MRTEVVVAALGTVLLGAVIWAAQQDTPAVAEVAEVQAPEPDQVTPEPEPEVVEAPEVDVVAVAVSAGDVPALAGMVSTEEDLIRGKAIVGLLDLATPEARDALRTIQEDETQSKLVRTWAVAARIQLIEKRSDLFEPGWNLSSLPEARKPFQKAAKALYVGEDDPATLLRAIRFNPELASTLQPMVVKTSPTKLVRMMLQGDDDNQRREAASYVGAAARDRGYSKMAGAVVVGLAFDANAPEEPWDGGALWIPSLNWESAEATAVLESLGAWRGACQARNDTACTRQIDNNLRSVGLTRAARRR